MKKTHNISLFIYDEAKIKENAGRYFFVKFLCLTFTFQIGIIFVFFVNLWGWRESLKTGLLLVMAEIGYLILFILIKKNVLRSRISQMFFQSVFMNFGIGVTFYLILSPFILNAYFKYSELFDYYLYCLGGIFIMALLYIIQLDMKQVLDNSLSNKKDKEIIFFAPDTVFWPLCKCQSMVFIPYIVGGVFMMYGFILRNGPKAEYYTAAGAIIYSAIFLYSEFCYFLLWIKYRASKICNRW
ncbi:TPA: hypothetical protein ACU8BO_002214 [Neisseria subflava]